VPGYETILNAFLTLLVILDPPGNAPVFLGLTTGMSGSQRLQVALRGSVIAFVILTIFAIAGSGLLHLFGITIDAFRVAGGLLLFWIAAEMIFEKRQARKQNSAAQTITKDHITDISAFPLAIPLIAGPGSISAVVLLSTTFSSPIARVELIAIIFSAILALCATLAVAARLNRFLGQTGQAVLIRLLGVLLAALSVQYVADGARALFAG
jgi:multiple antibiotic resistance protein